MQVDRRSMFKLAGAGAVVTGLTVAVPSVASATPDAPAKEVAQPATSPDATTSGPVNSAPVVLPGSVAAIRKAKALVAQMSLDEKIIFLHGQPATQGFTGYIPGNARLGIPSLRLGDGPSGVGNGSVGVTQWPDSKALAASWDTSVARAYGVAYGNEQASKGHNVALAPCINILRLPYWGRSFETYTEDPYLNGQLAANTIKGIQSNYVIATVKHFVANNQETLRNSIDEIISQRALEELYFPGFKAAVQEGGTGAVMTSYNKINGTWASENRANVQDTLRDTWGFDGWVMSDWGGTHSTVQTAKAGSDTEMPGGTYLGDALKAAVLAGSVSTAQVDAMVTHVLTAMFRVGLFDHLLVDPATAVTTVVSTPAHLALARKISEAGSVLLKNSGALPFAKVKSIAVIGDAADVGAQTHGGGSGSVNPNGTVVTPLAGIQARAGNIPVTYTQGTLGILALPVVPAAAFGSGLTATYFSTQNFTGTPVGTAIVANLDISAAPALVSTLNATGWSASYSGTFTAATAGGYRFSLSAGGSTTLTIDGTLLLTFRTGAESVQNALVTLTAGAHTVAVTYVSAPLSRRASLHLGYQAGYDLLHAAAAAAAAKASVAVVVVSDVTSEGMDRSTLALPADQDSLIAAVAAANPRTIVVLNTSGAVLMPWLADVNAVIANWYSGQEQGNAVAAMLFGDVEPSGRLTETFPAGDQQGPAKTSVEFPGDGVQVYYDEGLAIGYRWYQSSGEKPLFPFGFGLSYTTFLMTGLRIARASGGGLTASVEVRNTGHRTGSEVVQLYVGAPAEAGEPSQQLKAFAKVSIAAGQKRVVTMDIPRDALATWQNASIGWVVLPGTYSIAVGNSSENLPLRTQVRVK